MTDKTETLTVRADEVQVGDWIEWLGTVTTARASIAGGLWYIDAGPSASDPRTYPRPDTPITVTRAVVDPDADLIEAMTKADYEACGAGAWGRADENARESWREGMRAALAACREYQAAHPEPALATPHADDTPEAIIETLAGAQLYTPGEEHVDRLGRLIDAYQQLRPVGSDGKHGDRHAEHCGCTGKGPRVVTTADELDALPPGSVVVDYEDDVWKRHTDNMWRCYSGVGPYELADYLPATVLREGWGE